MKNTRPVTLFLQPTDDNVPEELWPERREAAQDRRKLNTYLASDRRSGIADRRKRPSISLVFDGDFYSEVFKMANYSNHRTA
jgi:hypothetical protein